MCLFLKEKPEKQSSNSLKIIVFVVGLLCTCLVFAVERMGEIISITLTIVGLTQGPLLGIFTLGVLFPTANHHVCRTSRNYIETVIFFEGGFLWDGCRIYSRLEYSSSC